MKFNIDMYCIKDNTVLKNAMEAIDKNRTGAVLVVDDSGRAEGIITDGDIRRALLRGCSLNDTIKGAYSKNYKFATQLESKKKVKEFMIHHNIRQLPVLDEDNRPVAFYFLDDLISFEKKDNYVFILAGGLGTRLRPLTEDIPKPMLKVGSKPILEIIIDQFKEYGFYNFIISINYMGDVIESYFRDGKDFDVNIEYVKEKTRLGTAGSIALAKDKLTKPFVVINGDILTGIDFDSFYNYHSKNGFDITAGVRAYEFTVPYGVVDTDDITIKSIIEKPKLNFYVNGAVYMLNPEVIKLIPDGEIYNMTDLINDSGKAGYKNGIYHITEYWTDIGQIDEYQKANEDVKKFF